MTINHTVEWLPPQLAVFTRSNFMVSVPWFGLILNDWDPEFPGKPTRPNKPPVGLSKDQVFMYRLILFPLLPARHLEPSPRWAI